MDKKMTKEDIVQFGIKMEMEGRGYFFESYVGRSELEALPDPLRSVCIEIQDALGRLDQAFIDVGVLPEEIEC